MPNYSIDRALPEIENGHIFEACNFTRLNPHTEIFTGKTGLTFRKCNLTNCDVPSDSVIEDCLNIHKSFCSNLHQRWIDKGLSECVENCSHVIDTDEIIIDSVVVDYVYHYEDTRVS